MISLLINIAVFGVGGIVLNVALQGLLFILLGRGTRPASRVVLGVAAALVLIVLPVLSAVDLITNQPEAGFLPALIVALCVALLIFASSLAVSFLTVRRAASGTGRTTPRP